MKIAIASGKGGTGKTTLAVNLAALLADNGERVVYADCDVEEPNGHLFLKPEISNTWEIGIAKPEINLDLCDGCGKCGEICRFSAIIVIKEKVLTFPELCHGCGGCKLVCPQKAITEKTGNIGMVESGSAKGITFIAGKLNVGQPSGVRIIKEIIRFTANGDGYVLLDAPPGTSCPVIETVRDADFVILVTEPTPFGLNDLKLAISLMRELGIAHGVVINRAGSGDNRVKDYCATRNIRLIGAIPDDRRIAESYSKGNLLINELPEYRNSFRDIFNYVKHNVKQTI